MRRKTLIPGLVVASVLAIATAAAAQVQTKSKVPAPAAPSASHAYDKLSLGNQKAASALYQAQSSRATAIKASGSSPAPKPLSLEEIATRRRSGQTWGQIFRDMKAQGLVQERTLGQVVANYLKTVDEPARMLASDRSTGRTSPLEVESYGYAETAQGIGKGGK